MTDERILETEVLEELPTDHRPDDEWIAAKLRVDHEFKKRMAAGVQRKFKRNFQGGMGTGYSTFDEVWCHYKPTQEQLEKWINDEHRGEKRIDEQSATRGDGGEEVHDSGDESTSTTLGDQTTSMSDADEERKCDDSEGKSVSRSDGHVQGGHHEVQSQGGKGQDTGTNVSAATAGDTLKDGAPDTWLGMLPALRDGPQQA
jgi:platelet-activating factor acetylhydrolase